MYEELAKEILKMLQLESGEDVNEYAIPNIAMLIAARVNSKLLELRVMPNFVGRWTLYSIPDSMPCIKEEVFVKYKDGSYGIDYWDEEKDLDNNVVEFMRIP